MDESIAQIRTGSRKDPAPLRLLPQRALAELVDGRSSRRSLHYAAEWAKAHERSINTLELARAFAHAARHVNQPPRGQNRSKAERTIQHRAGDFAHPTPEATARSARRRGRGRRD